MSEGSIINAEVKKIRSNRPNSPLAAAGNIITNSRTRERR